MVLLKYLNNNLATYYIQPGLPAIGLRSGLDPSGLDRPGRLPHQQGLCDSGLKSLLIKSLCEARLGYRDYWAPGFKVGELMLQIGLQRTHNS